MGYFLREKSKDFDKFNALKALVENESGHKIKCLCSNNRGELTSNYFKKLS